jgi:hypothetical protein
MLSQKSKKGIETKQLFVSEQHRGGQLVHILTKNRYMGGNLVLLGHEFDFPLPKKSQAVKYHMLADGHPQTRFQLSKDVHALTVMPRLDITFIFLYT